MISTIKGFANRVKRAATAFAYDAVEENAGRRKRTNPQTRSEDRELFPNQRRELLSATRDLQRNFSIAAWAIRKHLDYVSSFKFKANSGIPEVDDELESLMTWYSRKDNCDVAGRHSLPRMVRMIEERRTVDGDIFINQLNDGRLQAIEGDRVRNPTEGLPSNIDTAKLDHGVLTDDNGKALAYSVCDRPRKSSSLVFRAMLSASFCPQLAYYTRFDQTRGVSLLAPAINVFRDVYENFDYALAKAKVSQLFGIKIKRDAPESFGNITSEEGDEETDDPRYKIDFGHRGPILMDLDPGDDADILESATPSTEFQQFTQEMVGAGLKALDIPVCFYDEGRANFSSGRQAWLLYDQSAQSKRADLRELLDLLTAWRIKLWVNRGIWTLPKGVRLTDINWEWIHAGIPWIDPLKEATANAIEINSGINSRQRICKERGIDFFQIVDELAEEKLYAEQKGVVFTETPVSVSVGGDNTGTAPDQTK